MTKKPTDPRMDAHRGAMSELAKIITSKKKAKAKAASTPPDSDKDRAALTPGVMPTSPGEHLMAEPAEAPTDEPGSDSDEDDGMYNPVKRYLMRNKAQKGMPPQSVAFAGKRTLPPAKPVSMAKPKPYNR